MKTPLAPCAALILVALMGGCQSAPLSVLVFSRTQGFRHDSIPAGLKAIEKLGTEHDFCVTTTEDPRQFTSASLKTHHVVIFLNTTGDVLDDLQQVAFEEFIRRGGGFVGVHSAADTEYDWPFYGGLVGAYFKNHPAIQSATITIVNREHPATIDLPESWTRVDEWYNYIAPPPPEVQILLALDTSSYEGSEMIDDHPIAWCHEYEGGRAFYTGLGHTDESYAEDLFLQHLLGGILWAGNRATNTE